MQTESTDKLLLKIEDLQNKLFEANQLINAIKEGEVDAFAVSRNNKSEVYTLQSGDYAYRILIEKFGEGAVNLTEDGLIVYSNTCFFELLNIPYEKVVGTSIFEFIAAGSKEKFNALFALALTGNSKGEIVFSVGDKSISAYVSLTSLQPDLATVGMIITDLTEKKLHEEGIASYQEQLLRTYVKKQSAKRINIIMETLPQMTWTNLPDGNVNFFNKGWYTYTGLNYKQSKGWNWQAVVHPDDLAATLEAYNRALCSGETFIVENRYRRADGAYRWHLNRALPVRNEKNEIKLWVGAATDIHDQKNFTNELERKVDERTRQLAAKNRELESQNAELASFTYIASHDLQEPLRKIQVFSSRILDKEQQNFSEIGKDYFARIRKAASRMQNLIDALLSYSRTNASDVVFKTTDLNSMLNEVKRNLYEDIKEKNVLIESVPLPELKVIPLQFHQLILNLIANAIKYSRSGVRPHIKISAGLVAANLESVARQTQLVSYDSEIEEECIPEYWRISIADNGIGFRQEHANKIFELFQRLHGKAEFEGTGIGLAICKKITQNHRGFMNAIGEPGVGATFNIFLPLR